MTDTPAYMKHMPHFLAPVAPITIDHAEGSWIYDTDGGKWLDFVVGIAVSLMVIPILCSVMRETFAQAPLEQEPGQTETLMLLPTITAALADVGMTRRDVEFTCSGSADYLTGGTFTFVQMLEAAGAWPPISESHVEMDGAGALYEAWVRLQHGDVEGALGIVQWFDNGSHISKISAECSNGVVHAEVEEEREGSDYAPQTPESELTGYSST